MSPIASTVASPTISYQQYRKPQVTFYFNSVRHPRLLRWFVRSRLPKEIHKMQSDTIRSPGRRMEGKDCDCSLVAAMSMTSAHTPQSFSGSATKRSSSSSSTVWPTSYEGSPHSPSPTIQTCPSPSSSPQSTKSNASFYKVSLCNFYRKGKCINGAKCRFAHGIGELRVPEDKCIISGIKHQSIHPCAWPGPRQ